MDFYNSIEKDIIHDLEGLKDILTKKQVKHFYNCLRYLIDHNRINIIPVTTKNGEISHYKEALFWDENDNVINIVGSCNFTYKGIVCNGESFVINRSWGEVSEQANIKNEIQDYEKIFKKESKDFIYLKPNKLINIIKEKSIKLDGKQLLEDELNLVDVNTELYTEEEWQIVEVNNQLKAKYEETVKKILFDPKFPFTQGPREYQQLAYSRWCGNNFSGIFAMATGTGKTITSLNCVVEEYKKTNEYSVIITVPTVTLVNQWVEEAKKFNLTNIISTSQNGNWEQDLNRQLMNYKYKMSDNTNYVFITTYATFNKSRCQEIISKIDNLNTILIADEMHNFGATNTIKNLPKNIFKRIGLSATPERIYDTIGSSKLYEYFDSYAPLYTFKLSMKEAIDLGFLTPYYYYPYFLTLEYEELEQYLIISRDLLKHYNFDTGTFRESATPLLIKRKRIIHKAQNKKEVLRKIFRDVELKNESLKYTFVYVPEGYESNIPDDDHSIEDEDIRIINEYSKIISEFGYKTYQFLGETNDREKILQQFKDGQLEILTAMKTLDEGVDIPITKNAIFCASTGNPRQFIQRRGRILRLHKGKTHANIYDMIVIPSNDLMLSESPELKKMEINIFRTELNRVANFLYSSENMMEALDDQLKYLAEKYEIDIYSLINKNTEEDKKQ